ncbi:hypothetical protein COK72_17220 [Bacillus thuringiensis]|uniref:Uncharacterized protein n=1 Tax=Bacillus thuringiensis TaxID=1428 RepID=A0A9X7ALM6_BACTU|nr:hypothetical protein COK72_17220 [Bacillus thuringiensis]
MARSECEVDGASDLEALFASGGEAKPPNILATVAGLYKKRKWLALKPPIKKEKAPLFIKAKPLFSYLRFFFFFLNPGTFSKNPFFFLPLPSFFPG